MRWNELESGDIVTRWADGETRMLVRKVPIVEKSKYESKANWFPTHEALWLFMGRAETVRDKLDAGDINENFFTVKRLA